MDTHETDASVWSPEEPADAHDEESGALEEDVVVIESHDTGYADSEPDQPEVAPAVAEARADTPPVADTPAEADTPAVAGAPAASDIAAADARQWSDIKAMFVDDPGESVKLASGLVEQAIENLVSSLRQRQDSLSSWESGDASDTEGLRNVLRSYRNLFDQLDGMSGQFSSAQERVGRS
jgi:hypothetical protein